MGTKNIGGFETGTSTAPVGDSGSNDLTANTSKKFTWASGIQKHVLIQNHADSGGYLYVKFNADTVAIGWGTWDWCLSPGDGLVLPDIHELGVESVSLLATANMTAGTGFQVSGWL